MKIGLKKGFTLIELLIVIAIIGILAVALLPTVLGAPAKGRDAARKANLNAIVTALEGAMVDGVPYPASAIVKGDCADSTTFSAHVKYFQGATIPKDPAATANAAKLGGCVTAGQYLYGLGEGSSTGKNYWIASFMEVPSDANATYAAISALTAVKTSPTIPTAAITTCNLALTAGVPAADGCVYIVIK